MMRQRNGKRAGTKKWLQALPKDAFDMLITREKIILQKRYGLDGFDPMAYSAVASELKISKAWVREIELKAIKKLRDQAVYNGWPSIRRYL